MFKTIFQKLLVTYMAIIVVIIGILAVMMTQYISYYLFEQRQESLQSAGKSVEGLALRYNDGNMTPEELVQSVNTVGQASGARIVLLPDEKMDELKSLYRKKGADGADQLLDEVEVGELLQGRTVVRKKYYSDQLNIYVVFVGMPVMVKGEVKGAILLFSPLDQINKTLYGIYRLIWGTALFSLVIAALIIYFVSRRISKPIEKMKQAAAAMAEGDFSHDVPAKGRDEIAELARSFNYMKNRLQQVEQMRRDLIANVSHELRTPLTTIRGFIQGILDGVILSDQQHKYLKIAHEEAGRLSRLVKDILELARLQAGSIKLSLEQVNINRLIDELAEEYRLIARDRGITITTFSGGEDIILCADRDRFRQILLNLLNNAVKYSDSGGEICLGASKTDDRIYISVRDTGIGIPEHELEKIFEKFHRVDNSRDISSGGTGLGLAIVKELVELHGGAIRAKSRPEQGIEMIIEMPLPPEC